MTPSEQTKVINGTTLLIQQEWDVREAKQGLNQWKDTLHAMITCPNFVLSKKELEDKFADLRIINSSVQQIMSLLCVVGRVDMDEDEIKEELEF